MRNMVVERVPEFPLELSLLESDFFSSRVFQFHYIGVLKSLEPFSVPSHRSVQKGRHPAQFQCLNLHPKHNYYSCHVIDISGSAPKPMLKIRGDVLQNIDMSALCVGRYI